MRTKLSSVLLTVAFGVGSSSVALAQTSTVAPAAEVTATPAASATATDPNIDRGFLLPTAMTQPAGSITYNNYELLFHGVTYGVTDRIQATLTVLSPIVNNMPFLGLGSVKARIVSTDRLQFALQGTLTYLHVPSDSESSGVSAANVYSLGAGGIASLCLRDDCSSLLSASATYQRAFSDRASDSAGLVVYGGSIVHRVSPHLKLLGEVASMAGSTTASGGLDNISGFVANYGVRFHNNSIAGDVGFIKPFDSSGNSPVFLGIPFANFSYRWD